MRNLLAALALALPLCQATRLPAQDAPPPRQVEFEREIFYAILEGLFEVGPQDDVVDAITKVGADGTPLNFVYSCPVCMPAMRAFLAFRVRPEFFALKGGSRDFGSGLSDEQRAAILGGDAVVRRKAVEELVYGFVRARMDLLRLTPEEREDWQRALKDMSDKGNSILESMKRAGNPAYQDFESCPMCDGAGRAAGN